MFTLRGTPLSVAFSATCSLTTNMEYQINYTNGRDICATDYITARSHMEAWSKGTSRAQGRERVHSVYPMTNTYKEF
jgi:hypothetical protein